MGALRRSYPLPAQVFSEPMQIDSQPGISTALSHANDGGAALSMMIVTGHAAACLSAGGGQRSGRRS
jgi:hypothetical protein